MVSDSASAVSASSISAAVLNLLIAVCDLLVAAQGPARWQSCHLDEANYLKQGIFFMTSQTTNGCVLCFNLGVIFTPQLISWAVLRSGFSGVSNLAGC